MSKLLSKLGHKNRNTSNTGGYRDAAQPSRRPNRSPYEGISGARQGGGGLYWKEGNYVAKILHVEQLAARNNKDFFMIESEIVEASRDSALKVGQKPTAMYALDQDSTLGNINGFISSVMGCDPEDVTVEAVLEVISDADPLKGMRVGVNVVKTEKRTKPGEFYDRIFWEHVGGDDGPRDTGSNDTKGSNEPLFNYEDASTSELREAAEGAGIRGANDMSRSELIRELSNLDSAINYEDASTSELRGFAEEAGIRGADDMSRSELIRELSR